MRIGNDLRRDQCPACASGAISSMGEVPTAASTEYSTHRIVLERVPQIWRCGTCGSWFTQNAVPANAAEALYASGSSGERWQAEPFVQAKCPELIVELKQRLLQGAHVLDVGCSTGELLDFAKARGATTSGTDPSIACGDVVKAKGHRYGSSLSCFAGEEFDVVTAFDVVEHLYDLPGFLRAAAKMLRRGGVLIVLTGDVLSLGARLCGSRWWYVAYPEHIVFPSARFFKSKPAGLVLERRVRTYASAGYRVPLSTAIRATLGLLRQRKYTGLPSLGPDHQLLVLRNA